MSKHIQMTATTRDGAGKGKARATRKSGKVPAVIYGDSKPPVLVAIDNIQIAKALHSGHFFTHLCDLDVDGQKHLVLARDVQLHPTKDTADHVDFLRVSEKTIITVEVPLHVANEEKSPGLKAGGVLMLVHHTLEVSCRADLIPEEIVIDIGSAQIGDSFKVEDVKFPNGVKSTLDAEETLINIAAPAAEEVDDAPPVENMDVEVTNQKPADAEADAAGDKKDKK